MDVKKEEAAAQKSHVRTLAKLKRFVVTNKAGYAARQSRTVGQGR